MRIMSELGKESGGYAAGLIIGVVVGALIGFAVVAVPKNDLPEEVRRGLPIVVQK